MFNTGFCTITGKIGSDIRKFEVSEVDTLHLGDRLFLEQICKSLNACIPSGGEKPVLKLSLLKHGLAKYETVGILLDFAKIIRFSPSVHIGVCLSEQNVSIDPFREVRKTSKAIVNMEINSSSLRIIGLGSVFNNFENTLRKFGFELSYVGAKDRSDAFEKSIRGLDECKRFIQDGKPDLLLSFDNFWMHYCLGLGISVAVVQRRKVLRRNFQNHLIHLNTICGSRIYYVN